MSNQPGQTVSPLTPSHRPPAVTHAAPPLHAGDRLARAEFERRYAAHPKIKKAELIKGVVFVPSPVRIAQHSSPHSAMVGWLVVYAAHTPGVRVGDNGTVRLAGDNEPQPDAFLRLDPVHGGTSRITEDDYLEGPPELIVEIAASSVSYDVHDKRQVYQDSGVQEYLAVQVYEQRVDWFVLHQGVYTALAPEAPGVLCSAVFPGLWLQPAALWAGDLAALLTTLQQGLAGPEHAAFAERLRTQRW